ncbi:MAG: pilus assembly protein [Burkholderiaceae bacterium]|nr:pilus assembly protein [Burkholderiaceae bacterium]
MTMRIERPQYRQSGATIVEFALVLPMFLLFVFAVMELTRALYMINVLQEVTRRAASAAAVADFTNTATMAAIRRSAVFDAVGGRLPLGAPVTDTHVRIEYLSITRDASGLMTYEVMPAGSLPTSPARNNLNCIQNPYGGNCIRLVRARMCDPDGSVDCDRVRYEPLFLLINFSFGLSRSTTIVPAETLGLVSGDTP